MGREGQNKKRRIRRKESGGGRGGGGGWRRNHFYDFFHGRREPPLLVKFKIVVLLFFIQHIRYFHPIQHLRHKHGPRNAIPIENCGGIVAELYIRVCMNKVKDSNCSLSGK